MGSSTVWKILISAALILQYYNGNLFYGEQTTSDLAVVSEKTKTTYDSQLQYIRYVAFILSVYLSLFMIHIIIQKHLTVCLSIYH